MKALRWIWRHLTAVLAAVLAVLGAGWLWGYHRRRIRSLEDEVLVEKSHREVAALDARAEAIETVVEDNAKAVEEVRIRRAAVMRRAVAIESDVSEMSDEEVERVFQDLY